MALAQDLSNERWIKHYSSRHRILLVGEGDFSFSLCLARAFGSAHNMISTSLDTRGELMLKYPSATVHIVVLARMGCKLLHGVDAHTMSQHPYLSEIKFDRIVFNFPHAGLIYREHNMQQIMLHQHLVKGFFISASQMLTSSGETHVSHKTAHPFNWWRLEDLAEEAGLSLLEEADFSIWDYPGYDNKRGYSLIGKPCNSSFPLGRSSTFKFAVNYDADISDDDDSDEDSDDEDEDSGDEDSDNEDEIVAMTLDFYKWTVDFQ